MNTLTQEVYERIEDDHKTNDRIPPIACYLLTYTGLTTHDIELIIHTFHGRYMFKMVDVYTYKEDIFMDINLIISKSRSLTYGV